MEVKAIRFGNLVKHINESSILKVSGINNESIWVDEMPDYHYEMDIELIEPIPLTEDWLLKFGFEKDNEYYSKGTKHYHLPSKSFYSGNDHVSGGNVDARIKYVHQLQNLYFALTGEELTFNI